MSRTSHHSDSSSDSASPVLSTSQRYPSSRTLENYSTSSTPQTRMMTTLWNRIRRNPLSGPAQGLVITPTSEGRFVYWSDKKPFALMEDDNSRLITCLKTLPYQEGAPPSTIQEEEEGSDTVIAASATSSPASHSPSRKLLQWSPPTPEKTLANTLAKNASTLSPLCCCSCCLSTRVRL